MAYKLPDLPFAKDALAPNISAETLEYHHGKHHAAYVNNLNTLLEGTNLAEMPLEELFTSGLEKLPADKRKGVFNNAAQIYNHTFYWNCLRKKGGALPTGKLAEAITKSFGGLDKFKERFTAAAVGQFGSGWAWLVKGSNGSLEIVATSNAGNPLTDKKVPLLTCDVWEHAYYVDYRNARAKYVEAYCDLINWDFVAKNFG
ncbi:MAG: superoxide dismutase [Pseudomonadota bacterium]